MRNYLDLGSWNVLCDRCGLKYKSHQLRNEWTGLKVCSNCWEPRHPQTLIHTPDEVISTPWVRPESEDVFVSIPEYITTEGLVTLFPESGVEVGLLTES